MEAQYQCLFGELTKHTDSFEGSVNLLSFHLLSSHFYNEEQLMMIFFRFSWYCRPKALHEVTGRLLLAVMIHGMTM